MVFGSCALRVFCTQFSLNFTFKLSIDLHKKCNRFIESLSAESHLCYWIISESQAKRVFLVTVMSSKCWPWSERATGFIVRFFSMAKTHMLNLFEWETIEMPQRDYWLSVRLALNRFNFLANNECMVCVCVCNTSEYLHATAFSFRLDRPITLRKCIDVRAR